MRDKRGVRRSPWTLPHGQSFRRQPTGINSQPALQGRCIFKSFGCKQLRRPYTRKSCRMDAQTLAAPGLRDASALQSCLTCYRVSSDYQGDGAPKWEWQGVIPLKPKDFEEVMVREFAVWQKQVAGLPVPRRLTDDLVKRRAADKLLSRLGWQPRCKPTVLRSGRILLPLYSDTYSAGLMAISDDEGKTWSASRPLAGFGSIQPAVVERKDGSLVAYMRENGP